MNATSAFASHQIRAFLPSSPSALQRSCRSPCSNLLYRGAAPVRTSYLPSLSKSLPTTCFGGGNGGGRIYASKGYGGGGGGDGDSGKRRPLISLTLAYAVFVAVGGIMGYRKAGSSNSLISSLAVAAGLGAASYHMYTNPASYLGVFGALAIVAALGLFMTYGWYKNRKTFPQGITAALSLLLASSYALVLKGV